jgi:threonine/homoserine/homoserine lactone efflux protein
LIATAIGSILGPLGIFIVEITIGSAVADSLRQTAWIWLPLTIIGASVIIYFYIKSKK